MAEELWGEAGCCSREGISRESFLVFCLYGKPFETLRANSTCLSPSCEKVFSPRHLIFNPPKVLLFGFFFSQPLGNVPSSFISVKMLHATCACHASFSWLFKKYGCLSKCSCVGKICRATKPQFLTGGFCCAGRKKARRQY